MAKSEVTPLRIPSSLEETLDTLSGRIGKSKQETMRLCMELGAKWIELNGYDPTREITRGSAIDTLVALLSTATDQLLRNDQKLAEVSRDIAMIAQKLGPPAPKPRLLYDMEEIASSRLNEDPVDPVTTDLPRRRR